MAWFHLFVKGLGANIALVMDKKMVNKSVVDLIVRNDMSQFLKRPFFSMDCNNCMLSSCFDCKLTTAVITAKVTATIIAC